MRLQTVCQDALSATKAKRTGQSFGDQETDTQSIAMQGIIVIVHLRAAAMVDLRVDRSRASAPSWWSCICASAVIVHLRGRRGRAPAPASARPLWSCICAAVVVHLVIMHLRRRRHRVFTP